MTQGLIFAGITILIFGVCGVQPHMVALLAFIAAAATWERRKK